MNSSASSNHAPGRPFRAPVKAAVLLLAVALLLSGFQAPPAATQAQPAQQPPAAAPDKPQTMKGSIEGTVLDATLGTPVKDANILLAGEGGAGISASTKSDEKGRFSFKNLEAGRYALIGDHPRFARQAYGSHNGLLGGTLLTLAAGQSIGDLSFKLQPNAVASGKVVDADDEPVQGILVAALKPMYQRGRRQYLPLATAMTNDQGEFRLANLAAGSYFVSATPMVVRPQNAKTAADEPEQSFVTTYYPNSTEVSGAGSVSVPPGGETGGLDIHLAKVKSVRVKGKVTGAAANQPVTVRLIPKDGGALALVTARNAQMDRKDGSFEIVGATRGSYTLRAGDQTGMKALGAGRALDIADRPIEGIALDLAPNSDLAGSLSVQVPDGAPPSGISLKGTRVMLESVTGLTLVPPQTAVAEDGTFAFKELAPDRYVVHVVNGPASCYLDSAHYGTVEMTDQGLDLGLSAAARLDLRLKSGAAVIDGVVHGPDDNPQPGVTVALIPASGRYPLYQTIFTDQNGTFNFKNITPGDYKLLAWEEVEINAYQDPEFVKPYSGRAEAVSLKDNDHKTVTLKSIPRGQ